MVLGADLFNAAGALYYQLPACALVAISTVWLCRWIRRRDRAMGLMVQIGLALRLWTGLLLFGISYLKLPILQGLYLGDGFWELAPDARSYYWGATIAAEEGFRTVADWSASPAFVKVLAVWMRAFGTSPASAVLLNVCSYLGIAALLVAVFGRDRSKTARTAVLLSLFAFTFSPALLVFGTQALKDQFFALLLAGTCCAAWFGFRALRPAGAPRTLWREGLTVVAAAGCIYLIAGVRAYVGFLLVLAVAGVLAASAGRRTLRQAPAYLAVCTVIVALFWLSFKEGAGAYYGYYEAALLSTVGITRSGSLGSAGGSVLAAREGFVRSGGATNVIFRVRHVEGAGWLRRTWEYTLQVGLGTLVILLPISLLRWTSLVQFDGGRGLLAVTDLDTMFIGVTLVTVVLLLKQAWKPPRANLEYMAFAVGLCAVLTILMAFVVTNYGSLFRLRVMVASLLWLLPLALVDPGGNRRLSPGNIGAIAPAEHP